MKRYLQLNLRRRAALLRVCFSIARRETSAIHRLHGVSMTMRSVRNPQRLSDFATRISPQDCFCIRSPLLVFFLSLLSTSRKKSQPKSRAVIILEKYRIPTKYYSIRHVYYRVFPQYFRTGYFSRLRRVDRVPRDEMKITKVNKFFRVFIVSLVDTYWLFSLLEFSL